MQLINCATVALNFFNKFIVRTLLFVEFMKIVKIVYVDSSISTQKANEYIKMSLSFYHLKTIGSYPTKVT